MTGYATSLGTSDEASITVLGQDLARDLMGKVGFGELAFWLVAMRRPTAGELRLFEAVLVCLAEHGLTSLLAPVQRVTGYDVVVPLPRLERQYMPSVDRIMDAARKALEYA